MKTKTTKRRKVWVLSDKSDGHAAFSFDPPTAKARAYWTRAGRACTRFLEHRPGDVVLSREDASAILNALNRTNRPDVVILRALLRGGR